MSNFHTNIFSTQNKKPCYRNKCYAGMSMKSHLCIFSCMIVFLIVTVYGGHFLMAAEPNTDAIQKTVGNFLKQVTQKKITRVEVYYMGWDTLTRVAVTEDFLRNDHYDYKVIATRPSLSSVEKSLRDFKFKTVDECSYDIRLGYVFYAKDQEVLRLFFANNIPVVAVNGVPYKITSELVVSLLPFLPFQAYQEVYEGMVARWAFSWPALSEDKSLLSTQKESNEL